MYENEAKNREKEIWINREIKTYLVGLHGRVDGSVDDDPAEGELTGDCSGVGGTILRVSLVPGLVPVTHSAMSM